MSRETRSNGVWELVLGRPRAWMPIAGVGVPSLSTSAYRRASGKSKVRMAATLPPMTLLNPKDPFLAKLSFIAASLPDILSHISSNSDNPPFLDLFDSPTLMATPAQIRSRYTCGSISREVE